VVVIVGVSGSLRSSSSNTILLRAAGLLAPSDVAFSLYEGVGDLPHFTPDLDTDDPPAVVAEWRRRVTAADAVLICSPEYAGGIPGSMKNALDWLVGCMAMAEKPAAVINASPWSVHAHEAMLIVLRMLSVRLVEEACVSIPLRGKRLDEAAIARDSRLAPPIREAVAALARAAAVAGAERVDGA
jgi:chromate reductase, NAD(P)H dehydrogenase (quinone)